MRKRIVFLKKPSLLLTPPTLKEKFLSASLKRHGSAILVINAREELNRKTGHSTWVSGELGGGGKIGKCMKQKSPKSTWLTAHEG